MAAAEQTSFSTLFEHLSVPIMLIDERGELLNANNASAELYGGELKELLGHNWAGLDAQLTLISWKKRWKTLVVGENQFYDTDLLTVGELLRPVRVELVKINDELLLVRLEDRLKGIASLAQLEQLSDSSEAGYFFYNCIDRKMELSPVARRLFGLTEDIEEEAEIIRTLKKNAQHDDTERLRKVYRDLLVDPKSFNETVHIERKEGTVSLRLSGSSRANELHVTHIMGSVQEIRSATEVMIESNIPEELARFSIDEARDMIFWTRPEGKFSFVNQSAADQLGYDRKKLEGSLISQIAPGFSDEAREQFWSRLRKEKAFEIDYDLLSKKGDTVRISAMVNYLRFEDEEYACSFCRDITERNKAERRRILTESTLDNAREMIVWVDEDGMISYANHTMLSVGQLEKSGIEGQPITDFLSNLDQEQYATVWENLRANGNIARELSLVFPGNRTVPVYAKMSYLDHDGRKFNCMYMTNWSNKKTRDTTIELSQIALDQAGEVILWLEENLSIRYLNEKMIVMSGGSAEKWQGRPFSDLLPGLDEAKIRQGEHFEQELRNRNNQIRKIDFRCTQLKHDNKLYYILAGRDITKRLEADQKLRTAYDEINELKNRLQDENITLKEQADAQYSLDNIITVSKKYRKVLQQISQVADVDTTVLITGETGTGKELLARAVHKLSEREDEPMIKVNCAALPENLIESELFGHEKGAFTGATSRKKGRFELAHKGTIFLDEIGELPLDLQSKLLRVLQEGEFERLGGMETVKVDVRLVAATNRNLAKMVAERRFREDLYYRLNVFPIVNMPLRERPEDIPVLIEHFAGKFAKQQGKKINKISAADLEKIKKYSFPGNIRELENIVERAVVLCNSDTLRIEVDASRKASIQTSEDLLDFEAMQRQHIINALKRTNGRITGDEGAGRLLKLNDRTLMSKMRKLNIEKRDYFQ